jgi:hypothetical protein
MPTMRLAEGLVHRKWARAVGGRIMAVMQAPKVLCDSTLA